MNERVSNGHQVQIVDGEYLHGDSSDSCQAFQFRAYKAKMFAPEVPAGVKKPHDFSRFHIPPGDVGSFVAVAVKTGECQILQAGRSCVLPRDDVIDLERKTVVRMRDLAVLTTISGTLPDLLNQG